MRWKNPVEKENDFRQIVFILLSVCLVSLAFQVRFLNSLSLVAGVLLLFIHPRRKILILRAVRNPVFLSLLAFFLLQLAGLLYAHDMATGCKELVKKAGVVAIPFFFIGTGSLPPAHLRKLVMIFGISLIMVCLFCLGVAGLNVAKGESLTALFYHRLVHPFRHHAVFFSFYIFFVLVYWAEEGFANRLERRIRFAVYSSLIFLVLMLVLLSSKLVLGALVVYLVQRCILYFNRGRKKLLAIVLVVLLLGMGILSLTENPVRERFVDLASGHLSLFRQPGFTPAQYFNGLQFRLLTWRFTGEILDEKNAWITGVGAGDAQHFLDDKYRSTGMYIGDGRGDTGFLHYNCHNVFLQATLESGIPGLVALLCFCFFFCRDLIRQKVRTAVFFFLVLIAFGFVESVFSTQYAIQVFLLFPFLLFYGSSQRKFKSRNEKPIECSPVAVSAIPLSSVEN